MKNISNIVIWILTFSLASLIPMGCANTDSIARFESPIVKTSENSVATFEQDNNKTDKLSVYTSFYPMYDFALKIGGDKINLTNMMPAGEEVHHWEPTASDITLLETADVFVYNGLDMEPWVTKVLDSLQNKKLTKLETAKDLELIKLSHDEHNHGAFDPHVWLYPLNAKKQMESIKDTFIRLDPINKEYYQNNFDKYALEFDLLDKEYKDTLSQLPNKEIIVSHEAFGYLCKAYGLTQVGIEGISADYEPDPARMSEIIEFAKEHSVKVIFFEDLVSPKVAQTIAKEIGAKTDVLSTVEALSDEELKASEDYISIMRKNLHALQNALGNL